MAVPVAVAPCGVAPHPAAAAPRRTTPPYITPPRPAPEAAAYLLSSVFSRSRPTPPRIRRKIPAANQRPCLSSMKPNSPAPPIPQATGSRTPLSLTSSDFAPKQAQARGPTPGNRAYQTCSRTPDRPQPLLATPGSTATLGCTGSKLGFHSCLPQIRRVITAQKPNTMLIKSATRGPSKSPCPIQGNEDQSFKGKRLPKPQKAAKLVARRTPSPRSGLSTPQPNPQTTTALLRRPRTGYPTMGARPAGWESGGRQARGRSATYPGFG